MSEERNAVASLAHDVDQSLRDVVDTEPIAEQVGDVGPAQGPEREVGCPTGDDSSTDQLVGGAAFAARPWR